MALTPKQESFCKLYMETGNASEAYRQSYTSAKLNPNALAVEACRMLDRPNISLRINELREVAAKRHAITVDDLLAELEEARQAALGAESPQSAAAVGATMGKAKLLGMDKVVVDNISSDSSMTPKASVTLSTKQVKDILASISGDI